MTHLKFVLISRCRQAALLALFAGFAVSAQAQTVQQKPVAAYVLGGKVDAIVTQPNGKVIIGGLFIAINGVPRNDLARLNADGTVDATWDLEPDGEIFAMAVYGNTLYLTGSFTKIGGLPRSSIAAVDLTSGLVTPWNPILSGPDFDPGRLGVGAALVVSPDGATVFVGGSFAHAGGASRANLAAIDASNGVALPSWHPGTDYKVRALALSSSTLYVGGDFVQLGGAHRQYIGSVNATTGAVTTWNPTAADYVSALLVSGNTLYVGGAFWIIGAYPRNGVAAFNTLTGSVRNWDAKLGPVYCSVSSLALSGTTLYLGGGFASAAGIARPGLAAVSAGTAALTSWNPQWDTSASISTLAVSGSNVYVAGSGFTRIDATTGASIPTRVYASSGSVFSMASQADGKVIIGGTFDAIDEVARANIARLNADGSVDPNWDPGADGSVGAISVSNNLAYVAGTFAHTGGYFRRRLAAIDLTSGQATGWNPDPDDTVSSIGISGSDIYVGGSFQNIGNQMRSSLAALDSSSGLATNWNPSTDGRVSALTIVGSTVFVGGAFANAGGVIRPNLVAIDASTGAPLAWTPSPDGEVTALSASGSRLFVGGVFQNVAGATRSGLAAFDLYNSSLMTWNPSLFGSVSTLAISGSNVFAGGAFSSSNAFSYPIVEVIDAETGVATNWNGYAPGFPTGAFAVSQLGDVVYIGGAFIDVSGVARLGIAAVAAPDEIFHDGLE